MMKILMIYDMGTVKNNRGPPHGHRLKAWAQKMQKKILRSILYLFCIFSKYFSVDWFIHLNCRTLSNKILENPM